MVYKISLNKRPLKVRNGESAFFVDSKLVARNDEIALGIQFICNRRLFGACYRLLMPSTFDSIGRSGGVMILPFVESSLLLPEMKFPGDIDLLIVPYDGDQLLISETLVVELKIVRASFLKQGKSPNEYGFSQANALLNSGFPYSAVIHLIISDESPKESWKVATRAKVIDDEGRVEILGDYRHDLLPVDLLNRNYGRLVANCDNPDLGILATYFASSTNGVWFPNGRAANFNGKVNQDTLNSIASFYLKNYENFLDTPKH